MPDERMVMAVRKQVCHYVGYGTDCKLSTRIASLVDEHVENAYHLIEPSYTCVIKNIKLVQGTRVVIEDSIAFGSEVIAQLLKQCQGLVTSRRFSPGYCDWDISQQKTLFRAVGRDSAGGHSTEGCLMIPRKSISGIIGIGLCNDNVEHYNPCKTCDKHDC